jgi:cold shock CspA family protein
MPSGTVLNYDSAKGFGFIRPDDTTTPNVFFHRTMIQGLDTPQRGARVDYDLTQDAQGRPRAVYVLVTEEA